MFLFICVKTVLNIKLKEHRFSWEMKYREHDIVYNLFTVKVHVNDIYIIILIWCSGSYNSSWTDISDDNPDVTNADLGLAEDHFSHPEV